MLPRFLRRHAASRRAYEESFPHQVGFTHGFDGFRLFADHGGQIAQSHRTAIELAAYGVEHGDVQSVEALRIDLIQVERSLHRVLIDDIEIVDHAPVPYASEQTVGDSRRAT